MATTQQPRQTGHVHEILTSVKVSGVVVMASTCLWMTHAVSGTTSQQTKAVAYWIS
jgi:hypothetical protein